MAARDTSTDRLLDLERQLSALRTEMADKLEALSREVERRVSASESRAVAWSAVERRIEQLEASLDAGVRRILEAVGAADVGRGSE